VKGSVWTKRGSRSPETEIRKVESHEGTIPVASLSVVSVVLMGAVASAHAADEWFVLSEKVLKTADPSVEIKSEGGRWAKDVKQVKLSVEGGDVEVTKLVLGWDNRPDDTVTDIGVIKAGGTTAPKDAPGRKGRLTAVTVPVQDPQQLHRPPP
jgi:hypothetical protein